MKANTLPAEQFNELFHNVRLNGRMDDNGRITLGAYCITGYARNGNEYYGVLSLDGREIYSDVTHNEPASV
jgi:hypothetical protein